MKLHKIIKKKLAENSYDVVTKQMDYGSLKVGRKTIKSFLNTKNVYEWLKEGHYDLKYASEPFIWKLVEVLDISFDIAKADIEKAKKRYRTLSAMKDPYLRAETNFRRNGEFIFALIFASVKSRISVHKESLVYKSNEDIFKQIGKKIRNHYKEYKGELPIFGKIKYYLYDHTDGETYRFTIEGKYINENEEYKNQT